MGDESNQYFDYDQENFENYKVHTTEPKWEWSFRVAAGSYIILLAVLFRPTLKFWKGHRRRRRQQKNHVRKIEDEKISEKSMFIEMKENSVQGGQRIPLDHPKHHRRNSLTGTHDELPEGGHENLSPYMPSFQEGFDDDDDGEDSDCDSRYGGCLDPVASPISGFLDHLIDDRETSHHENHRVRARDDEGTRGIARLFRTSLLQYTPHPRLQNPMSGYLNEDSRSTVASSEEDKKARILARVLTISKVLTWDHESSRLVQLSIPATIASTVTPVLEGILSALILYYMGTARYLAMVLSNYCLDWADSIPAGIAEAEKILCVQAIGTRKFFLAGQYVQLTATLYVMVAFPFYLAFGYFIEPLLEPFAHNIGEFAVYYIPLAATARVIKQSGAECIGRLLWAEEKGRYVIAIEASTMLLQLMSVIVLVVGLKSESLVALGLLEITFASLYGIAVFAFAHQQGWMSKYKDGLFGHFALSNIQLTLEVLKMSFPLALAQLMAHGEWQLLTLFAASMGPAETAVWAITQSLWRILIEIPAGMGQAAKIRIGRNLGHARPDIARLVAYKSLIFTFGIAFFVSLIFGILARPFILLFTNDETLYEITHDLVTMMCLANVVYAIGTNAHSILETQRRAKIAVFVYFAGICGVTLSMSAGFVLFANFGLESIMMACTFGYATIAYAMLGIILTTKWSRVSTEVILQSAKAHEQMQEALFDAAINAQMQGGADEGNDISSNRSTSTSDYQED